MSFSMFLRRLRSYFHRPKISILIPFTSQDEIRNRNLKWVLKYWQKELPNAEIIVGASNGKVFSKNEAFNNALSRSTGEVIVALDADAYINGDVIKRCARRIIEEKEWNLWYIPYRRFYRLTREATERIIYSKSKTLLTCPPASDIIENTDEASRYGHRYGAMCMIFPKEAIYRLGGFDERFIGWGGEDVALLRALDTLYGKHKTINNCIFHLWHPTTEHSKGVRLWDGQKSVKDNWDLSAQYAKAVGKPSMMNKIINGSKDFLKNKTH